MLNWLSLSILFLSFVGCSSAPEKREFEKDYSVIDAKYAAIPEWLNEPQDWARQNDVKDEKTHRYFVADVGPINHRGMACQHAKAKATADIASEITQFIKNSFGASAMGDPTESDQALEQYVEDTLAKEVQSFVVGAEVYRTYWEKRSYKKSLGADADKKGYVCHALVKITRDYLEKAIKRAQQKLEGVANPESKQKVQKALDGAAEAFSKLDKPVVDAK